MTPGWTNVRNGLAESHQHRPRGLAGVRPLTLIACAVVAFFLWLAVISGLLAVFR